MDIKSSSSNSSGSEIFSNVIRVKIGILSLAKAPLLSKLSPTVGNVAVLIIAEALPIRDPEILVYEFISRMSVEDILGMPPARSVQSIRSRVKAMFQRCCAIPLKRISVNAYDETACKLLFLIHRMVLSSPEAGKQVVTL